MKSTIIVEETFDYDKFKRLVGNRTVKEANIKKIIRSIKKVGAIPNPLIVNEKMEVIDGQNRLEALKRLQLKVYYIVVPGLSIIECRSMNIDQTNWTIKDYIESYAEEKHESYIRLNNLCKKYGKLGITAIYSAVTGSFACDNNGLKAGDFDCTQTQYLEAINVLDYVMRFQDIGAALAGRRDVFYMAIGYCFRHKGIDNERLFKRVQENYKHFAPAANMEQMLEELSETYNSRCRGEKVYLKTDYQKEMDSRRPARGNKWDRKRDYLSIYDAEE